MSPHQRTCQVQYLLLLISAIIGLSISADQVKNNGHRHEAAAPVAATSNPLVTNKILIPNLPPKQYQFWLRNHPKALQEFKQICSQLPHPKDLTKQKYFKALHNNLTFEDSRYLKDFTYGKATLSEICSNVDVVTKSCWGYENGCEIIYLMPECHADSGAADVRQNEEEKRKSWFYQADFGYILERRKEMGKYCSPMISNNTDKISSLECTKNFKTCRGQNLYMKFEDVPGVQEGNFISNYKVKKGNVGGWECDLQSKRIAEEGGQEGPLKSWFTELKYYDKFLDPKETSCDITLEKQVFIIKLDSPYNMYHYFCNFINLYATIHLNNKFSLDNEIIIWDNHLPRSKFDLMWGAFSANPLRHIGEFDGKRVCFKKFIFSLLPRMVDGLYYNTRLERGCSKTGLFDAFNKHVLHRLNVSQKNTNSGAMRVTMITRSTAHRKILNELALADALKSKSKDLVVELVDYAKLNFTEQLTMTQNTDVLVGIHGAGLTNLLFLPDWAALVELHACGDSSYRDLARLRGVRYVAPRSKDFATKLPVEDAKEFSNLSRNKLTDHDKFSNYQINVKKFVELIEETVKTIKIKRQRYSSESETPTNAVSSESMNNTHEKSHDEL